MSSKGVGCKLSKAVDGVASLVWALADGNEKAKADFQKAVSENLLSGNEDDVLNAFATYTVDVKAKAAELEELKSKARDANEQWDKLSPVHSTAAQLQAVFGSPHALDKNGSVNVAHMLVALKKAYIDMMDIVASVIDYAAKNHALMQALGIEMCFILAHEPLNAAHMAGVDSSAAVILGSDEFTRQAIRLLLENACEAIKAEDSDSEEEDDEQEDD